jgi:hypothetical protein
MSELKRPVREWFATLRHHVDVSVVAHWALSLHHVQDVRSGCDVALSITNHGAKSLQLERISVESCSRSASSGEVEVVLSCVTDGESTVLVPGPVWSLPPRATFEAVLRLIGPRGMFVGRRSQADFRCTVEFGGASRPSYSRVLTLRDDARSNSHVPGFQRSSRKIVPRRPEGNPWMY